MILAEVETHLSRPIAPTRRVALGDLQLPCEPAPGFGGILLGGIVARFGPELDLDLQEDLLRLMRDVELGRRIPQPRLRHRLQDDRVGLQRSRHRLLGVGEGLRFELDEERGTPAQHVLCAVYAAATTAPSVRHTVIATLRKGLYWRGGSDAELVAHLSGHAAPLGVDALADPVAWALRTLALSDGVGTPSRREVQRAFRARLRAEHPDHGAEDHGAGDRIARLAAARRILLG